MEEDIKEKRSKKENGKGEGEEGGRKGKKMEEGKKRDGNNEKK